jgi:hypothetical protein
MPEAARAHRNAYIAERSRPVTSEGVRSIPVEQVTGLILSAYGAESTFDDLEDDALMALRAAGPSDLEALRVLAGVYLTASLRGIAPAAMVADRFGIAAPTAGRWIAAAKDSGLLQVADSRRR